MPQKDLNNTFEFDEEFFMGYFSDGRVMNSNQIPEKYYKEYISQEENA